MAAISLLTTVVFFFLLGGAEAKVFDATTGAGGGDITQTFAKAWQGACASETPSKVVIPKGTFRLGQITVQGPCKAPIEVVVSGTLTAHENPSKFVDGEGWVAFNHVDGFTMSGGGVFDGQGATAWSRNECAKTGKCSKLPTNIRFNFINNALVHDITTLDSKLFHINVLGCNNFTFDHFTVTAPEDSLNTDGIHIGRSNGVYITNTKIQTGDDCISMGDGSKNIHIEKVTCGPGHGISVGSLGKYKNEDLVTGIYVKNCTLTNTQNGVRVKTWPNSEVGEASEMHFEDIIMNNVGFPVVLDQEYCPWNRCDKSKPSRVKVSNVSFKNIRGTYSTETAVTLVCSGAFGCKNVEVGDINLEYSGQASSSPPSSSAFSKCVNVQPKFTGHQNKPICSAKH